MSDSICSSTWIAIGGLWWSMSLCFDTCLNWHYLHISMCLSLSNSVLQTNESPNNPECQQQSNSFYDLQLHQASLLFIEFTVIIWMLLKVQCVSACWSSISCQTKYPVLLFKNLNTISLFSSYCSFAVSFLYSRKFPLNQGVSAYKMVCSSLLHRSEACLFCLCGYVQSQQNELFLAKKKKKKKLKTKLIIGMHRIVALYIVLNFPLPFILLAFYQFNMNKILAIMKNSFSYLIFFFSTLIYLAYLHF